MVTQAQISLLFAGVRKKRNVNKKHKETSAVLKQMVIKLI